MAIRIPAGTEIDPGIFQAQFDVKYLCNHDDERTTRGIVNRGFTIIFPVSSAVQASLVGTEPDFGEIGMLSDIDVAGAPPSTTRRDHYMRVASTGPYEVMVVSQNGWRMTATGAPTGNAAERIGYRYELLGQELDSSRPNFTPVQMRGERRQRREHPLTATLTEGGQGKVPSPSYRDIVTITVTPLAVWVSGPSDAIRARWLAAERRSCGKVRFRLRLRAGALRLAGVSEFDEDFELESAPVAEAERLTLDLDGWEGPLDLLLTLARTQKVDLAKISILALVEQYLAFIADAKKLRLEIAADYLVMAAWLAYLKSCLLLPKDAGVDPSPEELAMRLQLRLQRLQAMREAGARLIGARPARPRRLPARRARGAEGGPPLGLAGRSLRSDLRLRHRPGADRALGPRRSRGGR